MLPDTTPTGLLSPRFSASARRSSNSGLVVSSLSSWPYGKGGESRSAAQAAQPAPTRLK